jgi:hypothetical protein
MSHVVGSSGFSNLLFACCVYCCVRGKVIIGIEEHMADGCLV